MKITGELEGASLLVLKQEDINKWKKTQLQTCITQPNLRTIDTFEELYNIVDG